MKFLLPIIVLLSGCNSLSSKDMQIDNAAKSAFEKRDYKSASILYNRLWQEKSANFDYGMLNAKCLMKLGQFDEAQKVYEKLIANDQDMKARKGLAICYVIKGEAPPAITLYQEILKEHPNDADVHSCLGMAYDLKGDHLNAQMEHLKALELEPKSTMYQNNWGLSLAFSGHPQDALKFLEPLGNSPAATAKQRQNLAIVYTLVDQEDKARALLSKDLSPPQIERNLGVLRKFKEAMFHVKKLEHKEKVQLDDLMEKKKLLESAGAIPIIDEPINNKKGIS
jgi:Flp pilus assembly protein TadD